MINKSISEKGLKKIVWLFFMMQLDFVLTYVGINKIGYITEGNPLLVSFFELNFPVAFIIRLLLGSLLSLIFLYLKKRDSYKYNRIINFGLIVNFLVFIMHLRWIFFYLNDNSSILALLKTIS